MTYEIGDLVLMQYKEFNNWKLRGIVIDVYDPLVSVFIFKSKCVRNFFEKDLKKMNN